MKKNEEYMLEHAGLCRAADRLEPQMFDEYGVQRGLRDKNGNGVVAGLTNISRIESFKMEDGKKVPCEGKLWYRGYDCIELVNGFRGDHFGFEEVAYLLLFGKLPNREELKHFNDILASSRTLPTNFTRDVIMKAPSSDIMNSLTRSVLTLASYDKNCSDTSIENVLRQCLGLIAVFPMLAVYGYHAYNHYSNDESMYIHRPQKKLSTAENLLMMLRPPGFAAAFTSMTGFWYNFTLAVLVIAFTYFYTAIIINPQMMADDMKRNGGFIPGVKPGKQTVNYIDTIMTRITLPGSFFLAIVAILPALAMKFLGIQQAFAYFYGGTSLLIMVGVVLDTLKQIESYLLMRHYDGLMKTGRIQGRH